MHCVSRKIVTFYPLIFPHNVKSLCCFFGKCISGDVGVDSFWCRILIIQRMKEKSQLWWHSASAPRLCRKQNVWKQTQRIFQGTNLPMQINQKANKKILCSDVSLEVTSMHFWIVSNCVVTDLAFLTLVSSVSGSSADRKSTRLNSSHL